MPPLRFPPFTWGATPEGTPPPAPPAPPFWTNISHSALQWMAVRGGQIPRFEHIFPQQSGSDQQFVRDTTAPFGTPVSEDDD